MNKWTFSRTVWRSQCRRLSPVLAVTLFCVSPSVAQVDVSKVTLSGDVRVRSELDARTAGAGADHATLLRTRLGVRIAPDSQVRVFIQFSDSRAFGEETNTLTDASADLLDVHQAFVEWEPHQRLRVRVGRQELAFADERLIGTVGWANVNRSFDGVRATATAGEWTIDGFGAVVDERAALLATGLDPRLNEDAESDHSFYGIWASTGMFDVFAMVDRNAGDGAIVNIDRYTLGGYVRKNVGRARLTGTAAVQLGGQTTEAGTRQDIEAYMLSGALGYQFPGDVPIDAKIQADILSGDATPDDEVFGGFNTLYATNHAFYGFMDFFLNIPRQLGFLGLVDVFMNVSARPAGWALRGDLHHFWLNDENASGDRAVGLELDLTAARSITPALTVQLGYSFFNPSAAGEVAPVSLGLELLQWGYVQGSVRF